MRFLVNSINIMNKNFFEIECLSVSAYKNLNDDKTHSLVFSSPLLIGRIFIKFSQLFTMFIIFNYFTSSSDATNFIL